MQFTFKELRARKDLTQRELAKILGVSVATYNSWEKNPEKMPIKKCIMLAEYHSVSLNDILFMPNNMN